jgi:hypothetical protein
VTFSEGRARFLHRFALPARRQPFAGSLGANPPARPIVSVAATG